jgi:hypothetical protein
MKLDFGQAIAPVPWPIQSKPMASARKPTIKNALPMGSLWGFLVGAGRAAVAQ